jgi:HPt (histidine-containing phosphotransfer) domain-containing protein
MNTEQWQLYTDQITSNLQSNNTPLTTNTDESLERTWHKIQTSIISAALQHIPNKRFTVRNFQHIYSPKASQLHFHLKKLSNIIRQIKAIIRNQNQTPIPSHHNAIINTINLTHKLDIPSMPTSHDQLPSWINHSNEAWKALYHARNLENIKEIRQQINNNISKRCDKLHTNPKSMINSILNRHKDPVKFDNIKLDDNIITDTHNIKSHIQEHFDQWTGLRTIDQTIYDQTWQNEYQPLDHINSNWYQSVLLEFSIEEVSSTLV